MLKCRLPMKPSKNAPQKMPYPDLDSPRRARLEYTQSNLAKMSEVDDFRYFFYCYLVASVFNFCLFFPTTLS